MQPLRILIVLALIVAGIAGYVYYTTGALPRTPQALLTVFQAENTPKLPSVTQLSSLELPTLPEGSAEQLQTFEARASSVSASIGQVLGTAVQEASGSGRIQDKVFEYGRYLYCKQVVEEYDLQEKQ